MNREVWSVALVVVLLATAGCSEPEASDYGDAPESVQDGSLDYQDYKDAGCPYLDGSLDHETMEKCNEWIREQKQNNTSTTTVQTMVVDEVEYKNLSGW